MQRSAEADAILQEIQRSTDLDEMRKLIEGASQEELDFRPGPNEWSIMRIVQHLGDVEYMRQMRFDRMLAEDNPLLTVPDYPPGERDSQDARVLFDRYERFVKLALERLNGMSEEQLRRVGTQAPDPQVNRTVNQPTNVLQQATRITEHSGNHLRQMRANLEAYRAQRGG